MATLTTLASLDGTNEQQPTSGLLLDGAGNLFGTTWRGGASGNDGSVFEVAKTQTGYASTPTVLVTFNGSGPYEAPLISDASGNLFGTTYNGGGPGLFGSGNAFEIAKTASGFSTTPTTLGTFDGAVWAGLTADSAGNLFGVTYSGGPSHAGTVFEIAKTAGGCAPATTVLDFNATGYGSPDGSLVVDSAGNLFGVAGGGSDGWGAVFEVVRTANGYASTPTILATSDQVGGNLYTHTLTADAAGNLFGTTGDPNLGTVFEIARTSTGFAAPTILATFTGANGAAPDIGGRLLVDFADNLFGTYNGNAQAGYPAQGVFELAKTATGYASSPTTIANFAGSVGPHGDLIADATGNLFGTTAAGGTNGRGTVFEVTGSGFVTGDGPPGYSEMDGTSANDSIAGSAGSDFIRGLDGNDTVDGGGGNDDVNGNKGDDLIHGGDGADWVRGGQGNDLVYGDGGDDPHVNGNMGDDTVHAGDGNDTVYGGQGNDQVFGDAGNDLISGDLGNDTLTGGPGADTFAFRPGSGQDVVTDFNRAEGDRIQLPYGTNYTLETVNGNAVVGLGNGDTLTLMGVSQASSDWIVYG